MLIWGLKFRGGSDISMSPKTYFQSENFEWPKNES